MPTRSLSFGPAGSTIGRSHRNPSQRKRSERPTGATLFFIVGGVILIAVVAVVLFFVFRRDEVDIMTIPLPGVVQRGPYKHEVLEQGEVESSNNIEVRCEVRARNTSGPSTSIIDIIPEGTQVKKGDWLITFDSSALEQDRSTQRVVVNTSEALVIQAKALYDTSVIAKKEYLEGAYKEQEKTILNLIFVAEETLKKAQLSYDSIKRLVSRGLLTPLQLEGERFRVDAARNDLDLAKRKLEVLEKYTSQKMVTQLESDIQAAQVKWRNEQSSNEEEMKKLKDIEGQIARCSVTAPQDGQVVYANIQSSRSSSEFVVEPGAMVRERQTVIRLPDPSSMQVKAKIGESRINLIREAMPVSIRIDAFGENLLFGEIMRVNKYAEAGNFWSSTAKEYATYIKIFDPPRDLRVGLTAEVRIHVEEREDALQIPVQAVYEKFGRTFCLIKNGPAWDTREIHISSTNEKVVAIDEQKSESIKAGDEIVLNPRKHLVLFDQAKLPQHPPDEKATARPSVASRANGKTAESTKSLESSKEKRSSLSAKSDEKKSVQGVPGSDSKAEGAPTTVPNAHDAPSTAAALTAKADGKGPVVARTEQTAAKVSAATNAGTESKDQTESKEHAESKDPTALKDTEIKDTELKDVAQ